MSKKNDFFSNQKSLFVMKALLIGFFLIIVLVWVNELFDLPFYLFKSVKTQINWMELILETITVFVVGVIMTILLYRQSVIGLMKENRLRRLNKILILVSTINQTILRSKSSKELFDLICPVFVEYGYKFMWAGFCEKGGVIIPYSQFGFKEGYLDAFDIDKDNNVRVVIKVKSPRVFRLKDKDTLSEEWKKDAVLRGYCSSAIIPILIKGNVRGILNFYSVFDGAFDEEEVKVLLGISKYLARSLEYMENEIKRREIESEKDKLIKTIEVCKDAINIISAEGIIKYTNEAMDELFGYKKGELIGENVNILNSGQDTVKFRKEVMDSLKEKGTWNGEILNKKKDNSEFMTETRISVYKDANENIENFIGIFRDTTERKMVEVLLKDNKKWLEERVKEKTEELIKVQRRFDEAKRLADMGNFSATIAHELRNPLGVIRLAVYNMKRKVKEEDIKKHLDNIDKKVQESDRIIKNILGYSKIKTPFYEKVFCSDVIKECFDIIASKYVDLDIKIRVSCDCQESDYIYADRVQIVELYSNILDNAFQAVPEKNGVIEYIGEYKKENNIFKVVFKDNGKGIEPEDLDHIYEPFFTKKIRGIGLGLALCRQVVLFYGGKIDIKSVKKQGTEVMVSLPIVPENMDKEILDMNKIKIEDSK